MFFVALYIYYMSGRCDVVWNIFTTCQEDVMWFGMLFYRDCKRKFK